MMSAAQATRRCMRVKLSNPASFLHFHLMEEAQEEKDIFFLLCINKNISSMERIQYAECQMPSWKLYFNLWHWNCNTGGKKVWGARALSGMNTSWAAQDIVSGRYVGFWRQWQTRGSGSHFWRKAFHIFQGFTVLYWSTFQRVTDTKAVRVRYIKCCIFPCLLKQKSTFLLASHIEQSGLQADPQVLEANMRKTTNFEWKSLSNNSWLHLQHFLRAVRCYHKFNFHGAYFLIDVVKQMNSTDKIEVKLRRECQDKFWWHKQQIVWAIIPNATKQAWQWHIVHFDHSATMRGVLHNWWTMRPTQCTIWDLYSAHHQKSRWVDEVYEVMIMLFTDFCGMFALPVHSFMQHDKERKQDPESNWIWRQPSVPGRCCVPLQA